MDASRIGKESQHNAPQDHIRVSWKNKTITSDTTLDFTSTHCRSNTSHPLQDEQQTQQPVTEQRWRRRRRKEEEEEEISRHLHRVEVARRCR